MKFSPIALVAGLAASATAHIVAPHGKVAPKLDIEISRDGNSGIQMTIANNGDRDLRLLNKGTILDDGPVEKLTMFKGAKKVPFRGVQKTIDVKTANDEVKGANMWTTVKRNQKITKKLDAGELHDLREGGSFAASLSGTIPYSEVGETKIRGVARYEAKPIAMDDVDGEQAGQKFRNLAKRTQLQSDCTGDYLTQVQDAMSICHDLSVAAASAARRGERLAEYFQAADNGTAGLVASRFDKVAEECGDTTSGDIQLYCQTDIAQACDDGVIAYTLPDQNQVSMCPLFWTYDAPTPEAAGCHGQDRGTTILHEFTHASAVLSSPTTDNGYGFEAIQGLSLQENLNNADTYSQYANGVRLSC